MDDLLNEPLIGISTRSGPKRVSLPELLANLSGGAVVGYTGLRAHQADPWHVFLVQLAASVLARHPRVSGPPSDVMFWRDGLLDLAAGSANAWELQVDDVTQPAFLQHPLASADDLQTFRPKEPKALTPDELDVLVTAKDHDVKMARARPDDAESWLYALLTYQTSSGFLGAGNYGTVRMNGGFASRCVVSLVGSTSTSERFIDELAAVMAMRGAVLSGGIGFVDRGVVLTWIRPWSRDQSQYTPSDLEPWFIESVRPLRLVARDGGFVALGTTSRARQIGPKALENGDVSDPWLPINVADKKKGRSALTPAAAGWTPELIARMLFQRGVELTPLQRPRADMRSDAWFVGSVLIRGQGTTEGFHRFAVPVPGKARLGLQRSAERERLGRLALNLLADAKESEKSLQAALVCLVEGGPEEINFKWEAIVKWAESVIADLARTWADDFFPTIWRATDESVEDIQADWRIALVARTRKALREAEDRVPMPSGRRYRALVRADGFLNGSLRKKGLLPDHEHPAEEEPVA